MKIKKFLLLLPLLAIPLFAFEGNAPVKEPVRAEKSYHYSGTDSLIINQLTTAGYTERHAKYWLMVAHMETASYTSVLCRYHNNLWGMSYFKNGHRPTNGAYRVYHKKTPTRFAGYKSKEDAVEELVFYLDAAKYPKDFKTLDEFLRFMKSKNYFEEPLAYYKSAIKRYGV